MSSENWNRWLEAEVMRLVEQEAGLAPLSIDELIGYVSHRDGPSPSERRRVRIQSWLDEDPAREKRVREVAAVQAIAEHDARVEERVAKRCGEDARRKGLETFFEFSRVGERTAEVILRGTDETQASQVACRWARDSSSGFLLLLGPRGVGKTVAAVLAMLEANKRSYAICVCDGCQGSSPGAKCIVDEKHAARIMWEHYGASIGGNVFVKAGHLASALHQPEGAGLWSSVRQAEVLAIDDLGREYADQHGRWASELDLLIDDRHEAMRRTIITSNLNPDEFKQRYGERIADRIRQDGRVEACTGASLRRAS